MNNAKRKWDMLSDEKRRSIINEIIAFFKDDHNEEIGVIAAGEILDFFLQHVGMSMYNQGVTDSKTLLKKRFEDLEVDLDVLLDA
jgi:uncharacterized protein (DUF2164 family)